MHQTPKSELETKTAIPSRLPTFSNEKNPKPSQQLELYQGVRLIMVGAGVRIEFDFSTSTEYLRRP